MIGWQPIISLIHPHPTPTPAISPPFVSTAERTLSWCCIKRLRWVRAASDYSSERDSVMTLRGKSPEQSPYSLTSLSVKSVNTCSTELASSDTHFTVYRLVITCLVRVGPKKFYLSKHGVILRNTWAIVLHVCSIKRPTRNKMVWVIPFCSPVAELNRWLGTQKLSSVDRSAQTRQVHIKITTRTPAFTTESNLQSVIWPWVIESRL